MVYQEYLNSLTNKLLIPVMECLITLKKRKYIVTVSGFSFFINHDEKKLSKI